MAGQQQIAAVEGRGECYITGANQVFTVASSTPTAGDSFATADAPTGKLAGMLKNADIVAVGGPAYYTNNGTTPDATIGYPMYQDVSYAFRNARQLLNALKIFIPVGTTLKISWSA